MNQLVKRGTALLCALALLPTLSFAAEIPPQETVHGSLWTEQGIFVNGVELDVVEDNTQYGRLPVVNGTVYIPLRTAAELLGAEVNWDETRAVLSLTRTKEPYVRQKYVDVVIMERTQEEVDAYAQQILQDVLMGIDVELRPDITLLLDGEKQALTNAKGEPVYPILFRDALYLPVRSVGELCGMEVAWLADEQVIYTFGVQTQHSFDELYEPYVPVGNGAQIHLYDTPTEAQLASVRDYLDTANQLYLRCVEATAALPDDLTSLTKEQATARLEVIASYIEQLRALSAPDAPFFAWEAQRISGHAWIVQYRVWESQETGTIPSKNPDMLSRLYYLRGQLEEGQRLLDAIQANIGA